MTEQLLSQIRARGFLGRIVPIQRLDDLRAGIHGHYAQGELDEELYQGYLAEFTFSPPGGLPQARSIIVVAIPQSRIEVTFSWKGKRVRGSLPPTYPERRMDLRIGELVTAILEPMGYRATVAVVPKKLLAVCSGLAAYGKNNITYVPGMGSFHGLVTLFSDLPAVEDSWREPVMLERCQNCAACQRHCPVDAITSERFLIRAERCITFHNEKPPNVPFPASMDPAWHNCLVGCLHCQRICPENRDVWPRCEEGAEFTQEETTWLLEGVPPEQLPDSTVEKLERSNLDRYAGLLPRNLRVLLGQ